MAQASHSPLLVALFDQIEHSRGMTDWGQPRTVTATPAVRARAAAEHRALDQAIAVRHPERAQFAKRGH